MLGTVPVMSDATNAMRRRAPFSKMESANDIVFSTDRENCERFAELLRRLEASVRAADLPATAGRITAEWLSAGGHFVFTTVHGLLLDALSWIAGRARSRPSWAMGPGCGSVATTTSSP